MSHHPDPPPSGPVPQRRLALPEFVAMLALLFATVAFSIDAMLPALPEIAAELTPSAVNRAQLILTSFVLGMGLGTALAGPISDAIGRKRAITAGAALYMLAAFAAIFAPTLESLLVLRFVQGLGAAGPRIAGLALVRDLYSGREMARITSLVMMIFIMIPAMAPFLGAVVMDAAGTWRAVFIAFVAFGLIGAIWVDRRQPETLPPERRRPLRLGKLLAAAREVLGHRQVMLATLVLTLGFGQMFALLSASQQIFADTYGRGASFPAWFAAMALLSGSGTILNARYVMRFGMRAIARAAYGMQVVMSSLAVLLVAAGAMAPEAEFWLFFLWAVSVFFMAGVTFGNLNALALQYMPHMAGMAASVVAALSTVGAVAIAAPVGLAYDGTPVPIMAATLACSALAWWLMRWLRDG